MGEAAAREAATRASQRGVTKPLARYTDDELEEALTTYSDHVVWSYNGVLHEIERRAARRDRRIAIATSIASVLVAAAALIVSAIALLMTRV